MKLAVVSSEYPPHHWGGVGSASYTLANKLAARGHDIHVFTRKHGMEPVKNHPGIKIHMVRWLRFPMAFALSFGKNAVPEINREGGFEAVIIFGNMTLMRREDFAALKFPCITKMCGTWAGERSALNFSDISLTSISGANDLAVLKLSRKYDRYEDYALLHSDAVIVECDSEIKALNERMDENTVRELTSSGKSKIPKSGEGAKALSQKARELLDRKLVRTGFLGDRGNVFKQVQLIDMELFSPGRRKDALRKKYVGPNGRLHLYVGRLAARKNVMEAARIFAGHLKAHPDDRLLFIGKGNQESRLRAFAKEHGLQDRMHIVSNLGFEELSDLYACADAFIFPSMWEGFGLVILEALASGLPVVSRRVGGAPEMVIDGKNGFLYERETEAVKALGDTASVDRKWIVEDVHRRYSLEENIDVVEAVCRKLAAEGKTRSAP